MFKGHRSHFESNGCFQRCLQIIIWLPKIRRELLLYHYTICTLYNLPAYTSKISFYKLCIWTDFIKCNYCSFAVLIPTESQRPAALYITSIQAQWRHTTPNASSLLLHLLSYRWPWFGWIHNFPHPVHPIKNELILTSRFSSFIDNL